MSVSEPRQSLESSRPRRSEPVDRRAARARRAAKGARRFDVLVGVVTGLLVILLAPGVAAAALIAVLVLLALGTRAAIVRRRRARRRPPKRRAGPTRRDSLR